MKMFRAGLPEVDTDEGTTGPVSRPVPTQVLEYTRNPAKAASPLINGDEPLSPTRMPHSITIIPEVEE